MWFWVCNGPSGGGGWGGVGVGGSLQERQTLKVMKNTERKEQE